MNINTPPDPYFNNIDFNPTFYQVIQQYLTEAYANLKYLKLTGGSLAGFLGIGRTARVELDVNGKVVINNNAASAPGNGSFGSAGTRIILWEGNAIDPPFSLGINANTLWYGVPSIGAHRFYTGTNERMVIDSAGVVGIGTTTPQSKLTINPIPTQSSSFDFTTSPTTITNTNPTSATVINDPKPILHLCREGTTGQAFASKATFNLCRYEVSGAFSRTRLDLTLTHNQFDEVNVLSIKSDGKVGIGTTNPSRFLTIQGTNPTYLRIQTTNNLANEITGIEFGLPGYSDATFAKITSTTFSNFTNNLQFWTSEGENASTARMTILGSGNIGIGTTDPGSSKLYVNGNTTINGTLYVPGTYSYFGASDNTGLRIGKNDIYTSTGNAGGITIFTQNTGQNIELGYFGGNNIILRITNLFVEITQPLKLSSTITMNNQLEIKNGEGIIFSKTSTSAWVILFGNSPTGVADSMIFNHKETSPGTKDSKWWFNGAQTNTSAEISDERIKKEINDIQTPLNKIMELKPKEYYLCDDKDYNKKFGIIAQDVEKVFPELIHTSNDYIANIYSYAKYNDFIITLDKDISNAINIDDELKIVLDNNDKNNLEIVLDDTPYNNRYKRRFVKVIEIIDNYSFKIDIDIGEENIFVYGKKVDDFKRLDYESLYCLNLAGTQELYKIIQQLRLTLAEQQDRISALEKI